MPIDLINKSISIPPSKIAEPVNLISNKFAQVLKKESTQPQIIKLVKATPQNIVNHKPQGELKAADYGKLVPQTLNNQSKDNQLLVNKVLRSIMLKQLAKTHSNKNIRPQLQQLLKNLAVD